MAPIFKIQMLAASKVKLLMRLDDKRWNRVNLSFGRLCGSAQEGAGEESKVTKFLELILKELYSLKSFVEHLVYQ